jgi:ribonuclease BN (tRNA processing enzyme)
LIHDGQYADEEYDAHLGWGHSALSHSLAFAARAEVGRTLLFHHDPLHSDAWLDRHAERAASAWEERGGAPGAVDLAREGDRVTIATSRPAPTASVAAP